MLAHDLDGFFEVLPDKERAQHGVSIDNLLPCLLKHVGIEIPMQSAIPLLEIDPRLQVRGACGRASPAASVKADKRLLYF